ncbi:hypothetical protein [Streptomyces xiamenensis]|uniref:hypothetical protein n=1 Tax=Streptomyces xiamenensis TaxID=408015 RepID=UPI0035D78DD9
MNTTRHLEPAPAAPTTLPGPQRPPAEALAMYTQKIYADPRTERSGARELLLAFAYALTVADVPASAIIKTASKALGRHPKTGRWRIKPLIAADLPRYAAPGSETYITGRCKAPRHRPYVPRDASAQQRHRAQSDDRNTERVCGTSATLHVTERDPATGWHTLHSYCTRHRAEAQRVEHQLAQQNAAAPEPVPNRGGLLPAHFKADWQQVYRWATASPRWTPPSWGISADEWPTPGQTPPPIARQRLRLIPAPTSVDPDTP